MDVLHAMRVFRRVVELNGFSAAARDQRLSNAAVSKIVAALEERLRAKLLNRTTRRQSLTPEGTAYYERCVGILDDVDETERSLSKNATAPSGLLRVNAPMSFGLLHVAPLAPVLLARWPALSLDLSFTDRFVDLVQEAVDVVVRIATELPDSASLTAQRLACARRVLCASPRYLRKHGTPKSPVDLARHECIVYSEARPPREWPLDGPGGPIRVNARGRLVLNNSLAIRDAVLAGAGISLLPSFYVEPHLRRGELRAVLTDYVPKPLFVHAVYARSKHLSPKVRAWVDLLRERFKKAEWAS